MSCKATINEVLLRFGFIRPDVPVQDAAGTPPKPSKTTQSLQAHDKQYHPNGWKPGDKCRLRDSIFNVDDLGSPTTGQGQQQPQQSSQGQTTQAVQPNNQDFPTESEFETVIGLVNANPRLVPPMLKQALDDLPKKIFDLAENQEYLDDAIADLPDGEAKDSLLADQQDLEKERMKLRGEFLQTYRVLSSILGTKKPEALTRNPALKHDPSQFPTTLDTTPTVNSDGSVDISFDGTSYHFTPCANGSTGPVEGTITINGQPKQFILKLSNKAGIRHPVPPEALKNEQAASEMLRKAGLNAPDAVVFEKNGQVYRLAEKIEPSTGLDQTPITQDIQRQLREAYPLLDLMCSHDAFRNDNIRVDQNGKVWFVDNGSSFAFKGYGDKKSASNPNWKGFDFEQRNDAAGQPLQGNDGNGGQKMYPAHYGALYESQKKIQKYLGQVTTKDLLKEASRYNMTALVAGLPKESKCQALEDFAASLDKLSAKAVGTRKVKSSLKPQKPQPAQGQATGQNQTATTGQGNGASQQQGLTPAQLQSINNISMPQGVGASLVGAGLDVSQWRDGGGTAQYPQHWYNDIIDSQNNQTAVNAMTALQSSLPAGYSAGLYDENGINGICIVKTSDKQNLISASTNNWPNGGFQQWIDGGQGATTASTSSASSQGVGASQQQPASKPASTQPSSSSSSSSTATSAPKFTYGSAGSLVKSGGFNDGNISTDISNLISSTGLQSAKGKMLLAAGTKLKTQGSIANNGDLYIGLPAGTKKSDLQAIANHLNNEYGQYGYSAYPMGGSWISIEPTKQNTMKAKQTATVPAASTTNPAQTPASAPATSQTPSTATTSTQSTQTATTNPGGNPTSQPASTTAAASNATTGQTSATQTAQTAVTPPPRKTLSQMIQQRLANANPQQQARFQAALNRANGNSGIPPQPQTLQGASQQPQPALQTSGQSTTPSGQQSQQTASTTLLTAPKSGNQPTPAQQKTIARFQQQNQSSAPTQKPKNPWAEKEQAQKEQATQKADVLSVLPKHLTRQKPIRSEIDANREMAAAAQ